MKTLYDQWYDGEAKGLNHFTLMLFELFMIADAKNRSILTKAYPSIFEGAKNI